MTDGRFWRKRPHLIPSVVAAIMLLLALVPWPYGYYQFLRWVVCGAAAFVAYKAYEWKRIWAVWAFGVVALVFNPVIPFHLSREVWQLIDLGTAVIFVVGILVLAVRSEEKSP